MAVSAAKIWFIFPVKTDFCFINTFTLAQRFDHPMSSRCLQAVLTGLNSCDKVLPSVNLSYLLLFHLWNTF